MATNSITIPVQYRKCINEKSTGYDKYYGEVRNKRPLSMMGFCNHMKMHVKVIVAALTAFLTAITTTSCMGYGPFVF